MKGFLEDANYSIGLLDEGATLADVIDNCIYEHTHAEFFWGNLGSDCYLSEFSQQESNLADVIKYGFPPHCFKRLCDQRGLDQELETGQTGKRAFYVGDLGKLVKNNIQWQNVMAPIRPFYPVRCNSTPGVLEILGTLGIGFACSSKSEMALVQDLGISPENIIYTNPCKQASQIKYAAKAGINIMTCDNDNELKKIARNHPNAKLLLHIATEDITADEEMNMKFGTTLKNCRHLMECAKELGVQIVGVKFHVSGSCKELQTYIHAISDARCVFDMAEEFGFKMNMLDIGGGFTGSELQLEEVNHVIRPLLDVYFPKESGVNVIAEPGCYYVSSVFTLAVNIIAKKTVEYDKLLPSGVEQTRNDEEPVFTYYINDGVYGSFASKLSEKLNTIPEVHKKYKEDEPLFASSLWGPSCDELDQIVENCLLPELSVGDWLIFDNMGSGTLGEQSTFNDYQRPLIYYMMSFSDWDEMQDAGIASDTLMKNFFFVPSCIQLSPEDRFSTAA